MNIFTEKGIAIKFEDKKVFIKIYPKSDLLVEVKRETALHLSVQSLYPRPPGRAKKEMIGNIS